MGSIIKALEKGRVLISDGAWGTSLHSLGLKLGECPEIWNITHRNEVLSIAQSYINAGSDMILTNSFGGHPIRLDHYGFKDRAFEINELAAAISREAAGNDHFVLGSIGPSGVILMMGEVREEEVYDGFGMQVKALAKGGVDAICIETMSETAEAVNAIKAAKKFTDLEVACTFTFQKTSHGNFRTMMGVSPEEMVGAVKEAGADIIGANCGMGFEQMIELVEIMRKVDSSTPILIHANAGLPVMKDGHTTFPESPEMMSSRNRSMN